MRLRTLLATTVAGALVAGAAGAPALAARAPAPNKAGTVVAWGDEATSEAAITVPTDLGAPVADVATSPQSTAVVTTDGRLRAWGGGAESEAPTDITDAMAVALSSGLGAVLHADGTVTAWGGSPEFEEGPGDVRAKAIAVSPPGTGWLVRTDGTLETWGTAPAAMPAGEPTDLVDVSVGLFGNGLVLRADGTAVAWHPNPADPAGTLPDLGGQKVTQIATGPGDSGVILDNGNAVVWGDAALAEEPAALMGDTASLAIGGNPFGTGVMAGAVTKDGDVYTWGASTSVDSHPESLEGQPVAAIGLGFAHAAVIVSKLGELTKPVVAGTAKVGSVLTAVPASFNMRLDGVPAGQWYADGAPIAGRTASSLTLDQSVVGKKITYGSTGSRSGQTFTSTSAAVGPVAGADVVQPPPPPVKAKSTVAAKAKATGKTKKVAKVVTINVTVKTTAGISPAGKVTVTLQGKTKKKVTATVNAQGKAKVTVKKVRRGNYRAKLSYGGNAQVLASTKTVKFKV